MRQAALAPCSQHPGVQLGLFMHSCYFIACLSVICSWFFSLRRHCMARKKFQLAMAMAARKLCFPRACWIVFCNLIPGKGQPHSSPFRVPARFLGRSSSILEQAHPLSASNVICTCMAGPANEQEGRVQAESAVEVAPPATWLPTLRREERKPDAQTWRLLTQLPADLQHHILVLAVS